MMAGLRQRECSSAWLVLLYFPTSGVMAQGMTVRPELAPPVSWLIARDVYLTVRPPGEQTLQGLQYLLSDTEVRISQTRRETYI